MENNGQFKKGQTPWNKGLGGYKLHFAKPKNMPHGSKNPAWKGDSVSYSGIHKWVNKYKNKTNCEICKSTKNLEWANKHHASKIDNAHSRNLDDWMCLCHSCHRIYDKQLKIGKKQLKKIVNLYWGKKHFQKDLAEMFKVSQATISRVVNKKTNYSNFYPEI